jgi:hypothetical protein
MINIIAGWRTDYPGAVDVIVRGFIEEGRRFASTPEGDIWLKGLSKSEVARRGRILWQACGLDGGSLSKAGVLVPSQWLDVALAALREADVESIITALTADGFRWQRDAT